MISCERQESVLAPESLLTKQVDVAQKGWSCMKELAVRKILDHWTA